MSRTRRSGLLRQVMGPRRGRARVCAAYRRGPRPPPARRARAPRTGASPSLWSGWRSTSSSATPGSAAAFSQVRSPTVCSSSCSRSGSSLSARSGSSPQRRAGRPRASAKPPGWAHWSRRRSRTPSKTRQAGTRCWLAYRSLSGSRAASCVSSRGYPPPRWGVGARGSRPSLRVTIAFTGAVLVWVALIAFAIGALDRSGVEGVAGVLGIAAALLFSLYLAGRLIAATAVLDATLWERRRAAGSAPAEEGGQQ